MTDEQNTAVEQNGAQDENQRDKDRWLLRWPCLLMLPSSLMVMIMDQMLANSSGGRDDQIFTDSAIRWGMSSGFQIFILIMFIGSVLLLAGMAYWVVNLWKTRKPDWPGLIWLVMGLISHPWILSVIWSAVENRIVSE